MNTVCVLLSGLSVYFNVQVHTRTHTNRATHCTPNDVNVGKCAASSLTPHQSSQRPRAIKVNRMFRGVNGLLIGALSPVIPKAPNLSRSFVDRPLAPYVFSARRRRPLTLPEVLIDCLHRCELMGCLWVVYGLFNGC